MAGAIEVTIDNGLATMRVNRPEVRNALDRATISEMRQAFDTLREDATVGVICLTGAGEKAFVSGADIKDLQQRTRFDALAASAQSLFTVIEKFEKPVIAAVNGFALGGGCELAMACDFIYAARRAKLGQPEVNLGIIPGFGGTQRLTRRVGVGKARELCMTGAILDAEEALRIGLVDAVLPDDELFPKALEVAATIGSKAPLAVAAIKRTILRGQDVPLPVATELEIATFAALFGSDDGREGMRAFLEKRSPVFRGQ